MSEDRRAMSAGDCDGNAAPYVLGALPDAERRVFERHLASCAVCREEVASLRTAAQSLAEGAPRMQAPAELKRRVMAEVHQDARRARARRGQPSGGPARRRPRAALAAGLALATLVVVAALVISGGSSSSTRTFTAQVSAPGGRAVLELRDGRAQIALSHMPQPGPGRIYEVWLKGSGAPVPTDALFGVTRGGSATVAVPGVNAHVRQVLVSAEPLGGSSAPTSVPVVVATLG